MVKWWDNDEGEQHRRNLTYRRGIGLSSSKKHYVHGVRVRTTPLDTGATRYGFLHFAFLALHGHQFLKTGSSQIDVDGCGDSLSKQHASAKQSSHYKKK